jgi:glutathione S-transferase
MITCYAFGSVPPFAQGLVRDLRVRWALEEAGLPYRVKLVGDRPLLDDGDLRLFESGAIVLYVAERSPALLPTRQPDRAHVMQWMFAALNTIETVVMNLAALDLFYAEERWSREARPAAVEGVRRRLAELAPCLEGRDHLVRSFSAADILMAHVLKILRHTELLREQPTLVAYLERCQARPAYQRALAGQMEAFAA